MDTDDIPTQALKVWFQSNQLIAILFPTQLLLLQ